MGYAVRPMREEDITQVAKIDREAFPTQWPPPSFKTDLHSRLSRYVVALEENSSSPSQANVDEHEGDLPGLISKIKHLFNINKGLRSSEGMVTQTKENIVGYASMWLLVDEAHLTSIAVSQSHRRCGIGELLLISIIDLALKLKAHVLTLEVRVSNRAAQALYAKYGFAEVGIRRGYYTDDREDALIMTTEEITSVPFQTHFQQLKQNCLQKQQIIK